MLPAADLHCNAALTVGTELATPSGGVIGLLYLNTQAVPMDSCDNLVADAMECQVRLQHGSITNGCSSRLLGVQGCTMCAPHPGHQDSLVNPESPWPLVSMPCLHPSNTQFMCSAAHHIEPVMFFDQSWSINADFFALCATGATGCISNDSPGDTKQQAVFARPVCAEKPAVASDGDGESCMFLFVPGDDLHSPQAHNLMQAEAVGAYFAEQGHMAPAKLFHCSK